MGIKRQIDILKSNLNAEIMDVPKPDMRMRRLRRTQALRDMFCETHISTDDFIYPVFVEENSNERQPIASMPGVYRETEKTLGSAIKNIADHKVKATILFGISHNKNSTGSDSLHDSGLLARMISETKNASPDMAVIADLCFCEYTDHGHCGVLDDNNDVDNDQTIENIAQQAIIAAQAGADILAPSGMMDGQVTAIRCALDESGFSHLPIMAYAAKFSSAFYGPFRDAAGCALGGDETLPTHRKSYQMNPANAREAMREVVQDEIEGADILMVKPGLAYLDILKSMRDTTHLPLAAYQVSGEYAMMKFAAQAGAIDYDDVMMENLLAFKRAGADLIITYSALDAAKIILNQD